LSIKDWTSEDKGQGPSLQGPRQGLDLQGQGQGLTSLRVRWRQLEGNCRVQRWRQKASHSRLDRLIHTATSKTRSPTVFSLECRTTSFVTRHRYRIRSGLRESS